MSPLAFSSLFVAAIALTLALKVWLGFRQLRHVSAHRAEVPAAFASAITLAAHQRAADYTGARVRLGLVDAALGAAVVVAFTLAGGLQQLHEALLAWLPEAAFAREIALLGAVVAIGAATSHENRARSCPDSGRGDGRDDDWVPIGDGD